MAVVDSCPVGRTCALRGCRPKKLLVSAAEAVHAPRDMAGRGILDGGLAIDRPAPTRYFVLAMRFGLKAPDVKQILFAYPTSASDGPFML